MSQLAKDRPRDLGKLPSNTEPNPRNNQCNQVGTSGGEKKDTCYAITVIDQKDDEEQGMNAGKKQSV